LDTHDAPDADDNADSGGEANHGTAAVRQPDIITYYSDDTSHCEWHARRLCDCDACPLAHHVTLTVAEYRARYGSTDLDPERHPAAWADLRDS